MRPERGGACLQIPRQLGEAHRPLVVPGQFGAEEEVMQDGQRQIVDLIQHLVDGVEIIRRVMGPVEGLGRPFDEIAFEGFASGHGDRAVGLDVVEGQQCRPEQWRTGQARFCICHGSEQDHARILANVR